MSRLAAGPGRALALGLVPLALSLAIAPAAAAKSYWTRVGRTFSP